MAARRTTLFKSGNSVAVRIPAAFGAKAGQPVEVREEDGRWVVEPASDSGKIDVSGFAGKMPWLEPLTPEQRQIEHRELDWDLKRAFGG